MIQGLGRFIRCACGYRSIDITEETPVRLVLRCGGVVTVFERRSGNVLQNSKFVGTLSQVERVRIHQALNQDKPPHWVVTVEFRGTRQVEVGRSFEQEEASIVAAHISTATGRPVRA